MQRLIRLLGSITIAVPLLVVIAAVLATGTIYEARFGTAAVQRFVYHAWWFQGLLGFLAINLAAAALSRLPWQRKHTPFLLAHLGIICILLGGILGGRFGVEGQLIIPEGEVARQLQLPGNVLMLTQSNPGVPRVVPTNFETTAWVHEPNRRFRVSLEEGKPPIEVVVDRYYPDAVLEERVAGDGDADNPAVELELAHEEQQDAVSLLARDPERFGLRWGELHLLFLEPETDAQLAPLLGETGSGHPRGVVSLTLPGFTRAREIPVPAQLGQAIPLAGTAYTVTFKDYFPDFAITEHGLASRSEEPHNPAVSFVLSGPEGDDAYLLFALHPDFPALHGQRHPIPATVTYTHPTTSALPPNAVVLLRVPATPVADPTGLRAVLTGPDGERQRLDTVRLGAPVTHPWLGYQIIVRAYHPRARVVQRFLPRGEEVKAEALHLVLRDDTHSAETWLRLRERAEVTLGDHTIAVQYQPDTRELPVSLKLLDFRKIDYPGTQMAAGFESDVQLTDPARGLILMRTIRMNHPLRYRGFSFYQSSYIPGAVETTVLSVRSDPGTPLVYVGFAVVVLGVVAMFVQHPGKPERAR